MESEDIGFHAKSTELDAPSAPSAELIAFRKLLMAEFGINPAKNPVRLIANAKASHPDLQEWIGAWQKSHFPPPSQITIGEEGVIGHGDEFKNAKGLVLQGGWGLINETDTWHLIGTIKNASDKDMKSATITFTLYDENRKAIGTVSDDVRGLKVGATWRFKMKLTEGWDSYSNPELTNE